MMDLDEDLRSRAKALFGSQDWSQWSIGDLEARVAELQREIGQIQGEIDRKRAQQRAAEALFGQH